MNILQTYLPTHFSLEASWSVYNFVSLPIKSLFFFNKLCAEMIFDVYEINHTTLNFMITHQSTRNCVILQTSFTIIILEYNFLVPLI